MLASKFKYLFTEFFCSLSTLRVNKCNFDRVTANFFSPPSACHRSRTHHSEKWPFCCLPLPQRESHLSLFLANSFLPSKRVGNARSRSHRALLWSMEKSYYLDGQKYPFPRINIPKIGCKLCVTLENKRESIDS